MFPVILAHVLDPSPSTVAGLTGTAQDLQRDTMESSILGVLEHTTPEGVESVR